MCLWLTMYYGVYWQWVVYIRLYSQLLNDVINSMVLIIVLSYYSLGLIGICGSICYIRI